MSINKMNKQITMYLYDGLLVHNEKNYWHIKSMRSFRVTMLIEMSGKKEYMLYESTCILYEFESRSVAARDGGLGWGRKKGLQKGIKKLWG